jgi:hypothetical protein
MTTPNKSFPHDDAQLTDDQLAEERQLIAAEHEQLEKARQQIAVDRQKLEQERQAFEAQRRLRGYSELENPEYTEIKELAHHLLDVLGPAAALSQLDAMGYDHYDYESMLSDVLCVHGAPAVQCSYCLDD